jgi:hypothetical protein
MSDFKAATIHSILKDRVLRVPDLESRFARQLKYFTRIIISYDRLVLEYWKMLMTNSVRWSLYYFTYKKIGS